MAHAAVKFVDELYSQALEAYINLHPPYSPVELGGAGPYPLPLSGDVVEALEILAVS